MRSRLYSTFLEEMDKSCSSYLIESELVKLGIPEEIIRTIVDGEKSPLGSSLLSSRRLAISLFQTNLLLQLRISPTSHSSSSMLSYPKLALSTRYGVACDGNRHIPLGHLLVQEVIPLRWDHVISIHVWSSKSIGLRLSKSSSIRYECMLCGHRWHAVLE